MPGSGPKTFHVRRLKGSVDSVHTLDRGEVAALRRLRADRTSPFVFVSERGGPLSPDMIARIVERAGGFHVHPHMLRHATGYALANEGTDTRLIQDFLGHASIANTVRYTKAGTAALGCCTGEVGRRRCRPRPRSAAHSGQGPPIRAWSASGRVPSQLSG
jgi:integrase